MKTVKGFFTALLLFVYQLILAAPAPPPGGTTGGPACWPPPCVPIDGGITFLIVAGGIYAAKKMIDSRKKALRDS